MVRARIAGWGALLAMALHALSPLAAPAPRDAAGSLHDICSSAPQVPQPTGDPSTSHCALCVPPASMAAPAVVLAVLETASQVQASGAELPPGDQLAHRLPASRAPPRGA